MSSRGVIASSVTRFPLLVAGLLLGLGLVATARAAEISFGELSTPQAFSFQPDVQDPIGFLTCLKIGGQEIRADMKLRDPSNAAAPRR